VAGGFGDDSWDVFSFFCFLSVYFFVSFLDDALESNDRPRVLDLPS